jgi:Ca2+-transporting ATPase
MPDAAPEWHVLDARKCLADLGSSPKGLSPSEAAGRLQKYGPNELVKEKGISALQILLSQFENFLVIILIAATVFSTLVGEIIDALAILIIVIINAIFGFFQEFRAEKTIDALKRMTSPEAVVVRGGKQLRIRSSELVPGDVVLIEEGTKIPADLRIIEAIDLKIDESAITGESATVTKTSEAVGNSHVLAERKNVAWMGTIATYGRGKGLVVATGMGTEIGRIAHIVQEAGEELTPLQKKLHTFGKNLGFLILGICAVVVVLGIFREIVFAAPPLAPEAVTGTLIGIVIVGIALAVAAIPEGLPAIVTITLALGLQRLAGRNALMRKLPTVETLGSTTVICSDKTGTLTKNEMTVRRIWLNGQTVEVSGEGYEPSGKFSAAGKPLEPLRMPGMPLLLTAAGLCNNSTLSHDKGWEITGDPTEAALVVAAVKAGISMEALEKQYPRKAEVPFSSERRMMSTVHSPRGGPVMFSKGAPETILARCDRILSGGRERVLTAKDRKAVLEANHDLTSEALRVLAVACRKVPSREAGHNHRESGFTFLGLLGMIDPPREDIAEDIALCRKAGIRTVMITGDHRNTAVAIAKSIGLWTEKEQGVLTGEELDAMPDSGLAKIVETVSVYARVNPEHKMKIVDALKARGHIIAMTGDGVNDAPALKKADIGIAMGIKGTDVAKEASDMILTDDHFATIVGAVQEGRGIYDNIKKFIQYLLSANLGEVLIVFIAMLIGFDDPATGMIILPITAIQLLWINLLTDGLPALALGVDPASANIMGRPPRDPRERILSKGMLVDMCLVGAIISVGTLLIFAWNLPYGGTKAMTMAFTTLIMFEMFRIQSVRMKFGLGLFTNRKLLLSIACSIGLNLMVVYVPFFQPIFSTTYLTPLDWLSILPMSFSVVVIMWLRAKLFRYEL